MERELDMHNVHQSFAVRKRVIQKMGNSDHLVIWFTDTMPGVPKASQSFEAIAVMDEWMANIQANPTKSVAQNRPAKRVDSCFDVNGNDDVPARRLGRHHQRQAQGRLHVGIPHVRHLAHRSRRADRRRHLQVRAQERGTALQDGTYAPWMPDGPSVAKLKQVFPNGVCDYTRPDQARP
jgi:hypothetical protein